MTLQLKVYVPPHPLIKHWLAVVRDAMTPTPLFRAGMTELGRWLAYEASRDWLPTQETVVETPLTSCAATVIDATTPLIVVPILRAGLALLEGAQAVLPLAQTYHIGIVRNEETLEPSCYLNKFPAQFEPNTHVLISEPMLATGGSILTAMAELTQRGIDPALVRIISVVTAPPALQKLGAIYPGVQVYAATIDEGLNDRGFIVPGLGDAGDRAFGT
ncbi:uracil phosphoribosyltransferase [Candidatus Synechococcus calcipolaris G9]|uniref:Uracil phosphoribosyltransferase n=1 Tax=Candidatus Synechococcus calcipolaris G9 TaxID=1497997 RepID=A0ABT6EUF9_9SYNE|nr:uracil phosphoribosyltransferase [Candidatus Synechococcus calcipolaris]MDG2989507.1 uracil phosphoribosyltransferase [Candidatus Synechococcus calcipolaris G9]